MMKKFSVVLELENKFQNGVNDGQAFTSKSEISFAAEDEYRADELIRENFGHRLRAGQRYDLKCEGDAVPGAREGFTIRPIH